MISISPHSRYGPSHQCRGGRGRYVTERGPPSELRNPVALPGPRGSRWPRWIRVPRYRKEGRAERSVFGGVWPFVAASSGC